jgi:hypothetical protein
MFTTDGAGELQVVNTGRRPVLAPGRAQRKALKAPTEGRGGKPRSGFHPQDAIAGPAALARADSPTRFISRSKTKLINFGGTININPATK